MTWTKMFQTGNVPDNITEKEALAEAYGAWGNCLAGHKMPDQEIFGKVMAELTSRFPSITGTIPKLDKEATNGKTD